MGNCQAIDNASLVIQHPCGRVDQLYWPIAASEVMKMNPGHYVALLLATTLYSSTTTRTSSSSSSSTTTTNTAATTAQNNPVRITRIKLLRPTDTLALGHAYRLITTQEVMKGVWAKKYGKMKKKQSESSEGPADMGKNKETSDFDTAETRSLLDKTNQGNKHEKQRTRSSASRAWHPSLQSITESAIN